MEKSLKERMFNTQVVKQPQFNPSGKNQYIETVQNGIKGRMVLINGVMQFVPNKLRKEEEYIQGQSRLPGRSVDYTEKKLFQTSEKTNLITGLCDLCARYEMLLPVAFKSCQKCLDHYYSIQGQYPNIKKKLKSFEQENCDICVDPHYTLFLCNPRICGKCLKEFGKRL